MNNAFLPALLVGALAGLAAGAGAAILVSPADPAPAAPSLSAPATSAGGGPREAELAREVERLRAQADMLSQRLAALEERPATAEPQRRAVETEADATVRRLESQLRELVDALATPGAPVPHALASSVREVYDDIQEEERAEREQRWADIRDAELTARMERYKTELSLDDYQAKEMRALLASEQDRREQLFRDARDGGSFTTLRDDMRTLRDETRTSLAQVLTEDQLERYEDLDRGRFGFPGGGPPDGGGFRGRGDGPGR